MTYEDNRGFADEHFNVICQAIKSMAANIITIKVASEQDDTRRATDYIVTADIGTIGCRIRRPGTWSSHKDLTIRYYVASGADTEYHKIKKGYPRWYLYGWSDGHAGFEAWAFIDMDLFRSSGLLDDAAARIRHNRDGHTSFIYYNMKELEKAGALIGFGGLMNDFMHPAHQ